MNPFNLKQSIAGMPCCTLAEEWRAEFLFIGSGPAPVVMLIGGREIENYTTDGRHLFDRGMDLVMEETINWNLVSPTAKLYTLRVTGVEVVPRKRC